MAVAYVRREKSSPERYDAALEHVGAKNNPPEGLILHAVGDLGDGEWQVIDIWESSEDADRAEAEGLASIREHLGDDYELPTPTKYELHNVIRG